MALVTIGTTVLLVLAAVAVLTRPTVTIGPLPSNKSLPTFGDVVRKNNLN